MKLAIYTQHYENYGAHDWSGEGDCPQYWKAKGGDVYVIENLTQRQIAKIQDGGIPTLIKLLSRSNNYFREYVADFAIVDDSAKVCDEWETPTVLSLVCGSWSARRSSKNDGVWHNLIEGKDEQYCLDDRDGSYHAVWILKDGRRVDYTEACNAINDAKAHSNE
jgi:hypothetical protein